MTKQKSRSTTKQSPRAKRDLAFARLADAHDRRLQSGGTVADATWTKRVAGGLKGLERLKRALDPKEYADSSEYEHFSLENDNSHTANELRRSAYGRKEGARTRGEKLSEEGRITRAIVFAEEAELSKVGKGERALAVAIANRIREIAKIPWSQNSPADRQRSKDLLKAFQQRGFSSELVAAWQQGQIRPITDRQVRAIRREGKKRK